MSKLRMTLMTALLCAVGTSSFAYTNFSWSGQVRARMEIDGRSFSDTSATGSYKLLRSRFAVQAEVDSAATAYIQFQDSRVLGGQDAFGNWQSFTTNDGHNVDVHQAYLEFGELWRNGPAARMGRFEVNFGNERVMGSADWDNVGRSYEGCFLWLSRTKIDWRAFWLKGTELNDPSYNRDYDVFGTYNTLKSANGQFDFFFVHEKNNDHDGLPSSSLNMLTRNNIGGYFKHAKDQMDFEANLVFQMGEQLNSATDSSMIDIGALMFAAEVGYNFQNNAHTRLAGGVDYSSGDNANTTDKFESYNNLYYTAHKFRGYMDYFVGSNPEGLIDIMARFSTKPYNGWEFAIDAHRFRTAKDYTVTVNAADEITSDVGTEVDFSFATKRLKGGLFSGGISVFSPKDNFTNYLGYNPNSNMTFWGWTQFTVNFQ